MTYNLRGKLGKLVEYDMVMDTKKGLLNHVVWIVSLGVLLVFSVYTWQRRYEENLKGDEIVLELGQEKKLPEKEVIVKWGMIADVHNDTNNFSKALSDMKARELNFAIVIGDMTNGGTKKELEEAKKVLDEGGVRYYVVPGNHDLWLSEKIGSDVFGQVFGDKYRSFKIGDEKFILINNGSWKGLGSMQKKWIEEEVKECKVVHCMVFGHMPLKHNFSGHVMGEDSESVTKEAEWLEKLFVDNEIKEMYCGHLHYSTSYEINGIRYYLVGGASSDRNTQSPRYSIGEISDQGFEFGTVEIY